MRSTDVDQLILSQLQELRGELGQVRGDTGDTRERLARLEGSVARLEASVEKFERKPAKKGAHLTVSVGSGAVGAALAFLAQHWIR